MVLKMQHHHRYIADLLTEEMRILEVIRGSFISFEHPIPYEAMETMEAMADRDLSVFMGRMDKLCQRLSDWKSATPQRSQSRSTSQSLANRSRQLSSG